MRDLSDVYAELRELRRDVNRLMAGSPLEASSIDRGGMTIRAEEGLTIGDPETGNGSAKVYGHFDGVGPMGWTGPATFDGPVTIQGAGGTLTVTKETLLQGPLTLHAGLTVKAEGEIVVDGPVPIRVKRRSGDVTQAVIQFGDGGALIYGTDRGGGRFGVTFQAGYGLLTLNEDGVSLPNIDAASGPDMSYLVTDASGRLMRGARQT